MLHPLPPWPDETIDTDPTKQHTMTLHFDFGKKPSENDIEQLGFKFNELFERNTIGIHQVRWGGLKRSIEARAIEAASQ